VDVSALFKKMLAKINSDYPVKYDLLRNYVAELIHYVLKLRPADTLYQQPDAKMRLTGAFLEALERQFPIEFLTRLFVLRSASDFARQLSVHVNYLNHCVRETTGKTTPSTSPSASRAKPGPCCGTPTGTWPKSATAWASTSRPI